MEKYKVGEDVVYNNHRWTIESIERDKMHGINPETGARIVEASVRYRLARLRRTPSCVFELVWTMAPEEQIESVTHELTAKEYAEKLREVFWTAARELDPCEEMASCDGMKCKECPFSRERREAVGYSGGCDALTWYYPDLAVKLMDEWQAEKSKPKGKTYLQDFMEKMPNARVTEEDGLPYICVKNVYGVEAGSANNCAEAHCEKCWNEAMPEEDNGKG